VLVVNLNYKNFRLVVKSDGSAMVFDLFTECGNLVVSGFSLLGESRQELAARMRVAVDSFLENKRKIRRDRELRGRARAKKSFPQTLREAGPAYHRVEDRTG